MERWKVVSNYPAPVMDGVVDTGVVSEEQHFVNSGARYFGFKTLAEAEAAALVLNHEW